MSYFPLNTAPMSAFNPIFGMGLGLGVFVPPPLGTAGTPMGLLLALTYDGSLLL